MDSGVSNLLKHFAAELAGHVERSGLPLRRVAIRADIPHQTLFNWVNGTRPRWHPALAGDLTRLADALELDRPATQRLLQAAGCLPLSSRYETEDHMPTTLPKHWFRAGTRPQDYDIGVNKTDDDSGHRFAFVRSRENTTGFGTLMQEFAADAYKGQRLRLSAMVKAVAVEDWAGLWMRIDGAGANEMMAFDNMQDRPIVGSTDWRQYEVVLDVAPTATKVAFGVLLAGSGEVRMAAVELGPVSQAIEPTSTQVYASRPLNLDFAV